MVIFELTLADFLAMTQLPPELFMYMFQIPLLVTCWVLGWFSWEGRGERAEGTSKPIE